jgi:hypothetical protein
MISIEFKDLPFSKNQIENRKKKLSRAGMDIKKKQFECVGLSAQPAQLGISHSNFFKGMEFFLKKVNKQCITFFLEFVGILGVRFFSI